MPWDPQYRKQGVQGVTANAIDVVVETGDSGPITPVGINLPNDQAIREQYGSKSVSLSNVNEAYDKSHAAGVPQRVLRGRRRKPSARSEVERVRRRADDRHARGDRPRLGQDGRAADTASPQALLKEQYSALEEARADLVALYFLPDPEAGRARPRRRRPTTTTIVRAEYEAYARNALVQLRRVREGTQIEEDHMRNRQMIVHWLMANTKAIERARARRQDLLRDGRRRRRSATASARLLAEVQRIKSEGDYDGGEGAVRDLRRALRPGAARRGRRARRAAEPAVLHRLRACRGSSRSTTPTGAITDVTISYPLDLTTQMLEYSGRRK